MRVSMWIYRIYLLYLLYLFIHALLSTSWFSWVWHLASVTDVFIGRICAQQAILPFSRWLPLGWIAFCVLDLELRFSTFCPENVCLAAPFVVYAWITYEFPRWPFYQVASAIGHLYLIHIAFSFFFARRKMLLRISSDPCNWAVEDDLVVCFKWRDILVLKTDKYILKY